MHSINRGDFGIAVVATMLLPVGAARAEDTAAPLAVHIDNFVFEPAQLTVKVGTSVTWTNRDDIPHTVVCAGKFRSEEHTSELQSHLNLVCRLLLEKKKLTTRTYPPSPDPHLLSTPV